MKTTNLFSSRDLSEAEARLLKWAPHGISRAVWFYNSLQIFLRDVERRRGSNTPLRLLSCDTTEIVSFLDQSEGSSRAFSFAGLVTDRGILGHPGSSEVSLRNLDRLITHHLLFDRKLGHVILDPHLEEVFIIEKAINNAQTEIENKFEPILEQGDINSLSIQHLQRIREWLNSAEPRQQPKEFNKFRDSFLPGWRSEFASHLGDVTQRRNKIRYYIDNARHYLIAPEHAGDKSLFSLLRQRGLDLSWSDFVRYTKDPDQRAQFEEIVEVVTNLANVMPRRKRTSRRLEESTKRDAQSIAILHLFNSFLSAETGDSSRVELVTRSQMYHMLVAALPEDRIRVSIRHPLLVPEIYDFDQNALQALGNVFQTVDGALSPILDVFSSDEEARGEIPSEVARQIQAPVVELVDLLSDNIAVQQTLERAEFDTKTFEEIVVKSFKEGRSDKARSRKQDIQAKKLAIEIEATFEVLSRKLRESGGPFSNDAILSIGFHNRNLLDSDSGRVAGVESKLRLLEFSEKEFGNYPSFVAARVVDGCLPRLFHFYSRRVRKLLARTTEKRLTSVEKREGKIENAQVFELAKSSFDNVEKLAEQQRRIPAGELQNDLLYTIEITLLSCMIFAANELYQTAASLSSAILSNVVRGVRKRKQGEGLAIDFWNLGEGDDIRVPLACKELFLLRHYCERAVSFSQLRKGKVSLRSVKGDAVRNLARAQRDLDLAVMMNEEAERIFLAESQDSKVSADPSPVGAAILEDFRFSLVHVSGWIDQFVSVTKRTSPDFHSQSVGWHSEETSALRERFDIWTAAGLVKDTEALASRASLKAQDSEFVDEERYFKHVEARAYQNALTMFMVFLAFDVSPDVQAFWNPNLSPSRDRLFAFRNWEKWYLAYDQLRKDFDFELRLSDDICAVCDALVDLRELRQSDRVADFYKRIGRLQTNLKESLQRQATNGGFSQEIFGVLYDRLESIDHRVN